jgi:histidinol-phosphate/aromatic aminotransferase/cobyric acid decarboxylase-like protein
MTENIKTNRLPFNEWEAQLANKIIDLKTQAGSHSPSIFTYRQKLPEIDIKVDACFLSNPYATDLFLDYFHKEIIETNKIRDLLEFYPSQNSVIAELLANFLSIDPNQLFIGNGAIEIIQAVVHNFTERRILINIPTFSSYYEFVKKDVEVVYNVLEKENDYQLDIHQYIAKVKEEKPDTIVLINPNNPNGAFISSKEIEKILQELAFVNTIILDESFIHFAYENNRFEMVSMARLVEEYPNLVAIKSMSKDFGIAGVRAGYGIMSSDRVHRLLNNGYLWNSNGLAEYFFRLYTRTDFAYHYNQVRVRYIMETIEFITNLKDIPNIKIYPSKANFVLVELPEGTSSTDFVAVMLLRYGIYVRTCGDKIGLKGDYIRLASRSSEENKYIIDSFSEFFG